MGIRTGKQFIEGLKSRPRDVWVRGERVEDVTTHPAFRAAVEQLAALYDTQHAPELQDRLTYVVPETGERAGLAFMPAKSAADLRRRREAYRIWAETNFGLMGRSPDFLNVTLLAFWEARHDFARGGQKYADNIVKYYEYIRDNDLFLSHALITPQNDRSKQSSEQAGMHLRVVKETDDGIYVSGARMIATLGPVSDELIMYNLPQFKAGDEDHAIVFAVPTDVAGLRQISRDPYHVEGHESYDHPLSTRFEENDSLLIFHDVFVPWERVFCYRQVELSNQLHTHTTVRNHTAHQTNTRALVKMQFSVGVAIAVAKSIKADQFLHVQQMLGELLGYVEQVKSALVRSEYESELTEVGTVRPSLAPLQAIRAMLSTAYPRVIEVLQTIGAGGLMLMPSAADFRAPELSDDLALYYQGAGGMPSIERVKLFKLAWDLAGEAFGQRLVQYERYYAGDPVRNLALNYLSNRDPDMQRLVDKALELAGDPGGIVPVAEQSTADLSQK
ncbi:MULTISPECIES: 4-hydroxyphenylacetate 3-hydroxylase family protein [Paraburkholderia]|uniref:4-hydroxyphenylacetate 3-hydroxylase family protein n=1 Tax=Paraburkholderia TaxID=1822464 RepID=UPI00225A662E|nr:MULTISPECIES: 4-hydroxyphenylacetate 3-hydroxylase N-terminal domain-containing protein [Paraburkholderia]MCX4163596.1 4-hydroxyphenylacetate 3-hydroxylase [Paraburkholderia megapolitana]MDN7159091.1 4-hydroxyphenylacetate 3-hydroxylase [Paraburkholderia sp. CHISQ3]MDQ6496138.1 4-hydroxyphenylacetate 3-hydroxylase [Paraburkholderia megapolitana]